MKSLIRAKKIFSFAATAAIFASLLASPVQGERIRDVTRLKNEVPNELVGMGLVMGLNGTGDGGDFSPAMRPLKEMLKRFDDPVLIEKELKNAKNVAIVSLAMKIPSQGAHAGEKLDVQVSAIAAKSLAGGRLFIVPMMAPRPDAKIILAHASGDLILEDPNSPGKALIREGGVLIEDVLPEEINPAQFTLVLAPQAATYEKATAIADQINEEVAPQTGGKAIAVALDATSVVVNIPKAEQANPAPFIAWVQGRPLPNLPEPATVRINMANKSIIFTDEVELAPTMISINNMMITVGTPGQPANPPGSLVPYVTLDPAHGGNAKLKELENAFNLMKVSADDRIKIVKELSKANVLKAKLVVE